MRVAEDDHIAGVAGEDESGRRTSTLVTVADVDGDAIDRHGPLGGERRVARIVDISVDRLHRCDRATRLEHRGPTDIPCVKNQRDAFEDGCDLRTQEAVRVSDETDSRGPSLPGVRAGG